MKVKEDRNLGMYILLSICTCGFYSYYFIYSMSLDANTLCTGDGKKTPGLVQFILLSVITCGFYAIYWEYCLGNRLAENAPRYGTQFQENGSSVLMWRIFGALLCGIGAFVAVHILIKNMNALAHLYNNGAGRGSEQESWREKEISVEPDMFIPDIETQDALHRETGGYTKPEGGWMPDEDSAWKPKEEKEAERSKKQGTPKPGGLVECLNGDYKGAKFTFDGELVIGRDGACANIVIHNPKVSRKHCVIRYSPENGGYLVTDESANGVFYKSGQAFPKRIPVACGRGTVLVIGRSGNEFILK